MPVISTKTVFVIKNEPNEQGEEDEYYDPYWDNGVSRQDFY